MTGRRGAAARLGQVDAKGPVNARTADAAEDACDGRWQQSRSAIDRAASDCYVPRLIDAHAVLKSSGVAHSAHMLLSAGDLISFISFSSLRFASSVAAL